MKKLSKEVLKDTDDNKFVNSKGCLYIIATPIGNFEDITIRSLRLLSFVDILICEDTRKTKKLLKHFKLECKSLISYNDNNGEKKRPYILNQLLLNKKIGLVSDAGTPLISDPGYKIVQECYANKIIVTHAPGPSSVINALVLSGLPTNQFYFGGFISSKKNEKEKQFLSTKHNSMTGIWFDTCLRLENTLEIMFAIYGNRKVSITRELTKIYEDIIMSDLSSIHKLIEKRVKCNKPLKGEIVIVIEGYNLKPSIKDETLKIIIKEKLLQYSLRDTVNLLMTETGVSKKLIYEEAVKIKNNL